MTFRKSTTIINRNVATLLAESRHLSFNLNIERHILNRRHTMQYSTLTDKLKTVVAAGPGLKEFLIAGKNMPAAGAENNSVPYLMANQYNGNGRKVFFDVYGCQMNSNDAEVVYSVLKSSDYVKVDSIDKADVVLLVTCSIRDNAETKVRIVIDNTTLHSVNSFCHISDLESVRTHNGNEEKTFVETRTISNRHSRLYG